MSQLRPMDASSVVYTESKPIKMLMMTAVTCQIKLRVGTKPVNLQHLTLRYVELPAGTII